MPRLASGELLGPTASPKPGADRMRRPQDSRKGWDGDDYLIDGSKVFISGAGSTRCWW